MLTQENLVLAAFRASLTLESGVQTGYARILFDKLEVSIQPYPVSICAQELIRNAYYTGPELPRSEDAQIAEKMRFLCWTILELTDWIVGSLTDLHSHSFDEGSQAVFISWNPFRVLSSERIFVRE